MSLRELSAGYKESAKLLKDRLASLREELKQTTDPEIVFQLNRRIAVLTPMLTEMNVLAELTERYYEKGYYRDERYSSNCFRDMFRHAREAKRNFAANHPERDDGAPAGYLCQVLPERYDDHTDSRTKKREQKYRKSYIKKSRTNSEKIHTVPIEVLDKFFT